MGKHWGHLLPVRRLPGALALLLIAALLLAPASPARAAAPVNDSRADATTWTYGHTYGNSNVEATNEAGETGTLSGCSGPGNAAVASSGHSVWFRFTPPASATYVLDIYYATFDTVLSVENQAGATLACNDDKASGDTTSRVQRALTGGVTYYIRLAGWSTASGTYTMSLIAQPPANNNRADAAILPLTADQPVNLLMADTESDEPNPPGCEYGLQQTVWYRYTANQTGRLLITNHSTWSARMRLFDVTSGVPELVVCDSYHDGSTGEIGSINQYVRAGRSYLLQVGRPSGAASSYGTTISASLVAAAQPANDSFATPTSLVGTGGSVDIEAGQMTTEAFEYPLYGSTVGSHSAWFRWTAPASGTLALSVPNSLQSTRVWADVPYPYLLDATGLGTLAYPSVGATRTVPVVKGTTYRVLADWRSPFAFTMTYAFTSNGTDDTPPATAPDRPAAPSVKVKGRKAVLSWATPDDGGAAITGYTLAVKIKAAGRRHTVARGLDAAAARTVLKRLKPGKYRVTLTAANAVGSSAPSPVLRFRVR